MIPACMSSRGVTAPSLTGRFPRSSSSDSYVVMRGGGDPIIVAAKTLDTTLDLSELTIYRRIGSTPLLLHKSRHRVPQNR